ncbi:MAG TPA: DUF5615 family PIN-like protein [Chloroflexota bacterium]|nr:DUF5615 family PIN-like protein [Chloroflexota bacterium]
MAAPPVYIDDCVDYQLVAYLQARGFSATHVLDQGMRGADDDTQLGFATRQGWALLTTNSREFNRRHAAWRQQGRTHAGLLTLPQKAFPLLRLRGAMMLDWIALESAYASQSMLWRWVDCQNWLLGAGHLPGHTLSEVRFAYGQALEP